MTTPTTPTFLVHAIELDYCSMVESSPRPRIQVSINHSFRSIGSALARLTIGITPESLHKRLPNLRPANGAAPSRTRHILLRGYDSLPVEWDPVAVGDRPVP